MQFFSKKNIYVAIPLILSLGLISIASAEDIACGDMSRDKELKSDAVGVGVSEGAAKAKCRVAAVAGSKDAIDEFLKENVTCLYEECMAYEICLPAGKIILWDAKSKTRYHTMWDIDSIAIDPGSGLWVAACHYTFHINYGCGPCEAGI